MRDAELVAILLRVGVKGASAVEVGERLLQRFGGLDGLARASVADLTGVSGVGDAKAVQLKAAVEIGAAAAGFLLAATAACTRQAPPAAPSPAWTVQTSGTDASLRGVSAVDGRTAWASAFSPSAARPCAKSRRARFAAWAPSDGFNRTARR